VKNRNSYAITLTVLSTSFVVLYLLIAAACVWAFLVFGGMAWDGSATRYQRICADVFLTLMTPAQWLEKAGLPLAFSVVIAPAFWAFLPSALLAALWHWRKPSLGS
jgi:hypothetical protein